MENFFGRLNERYWALITTIGPVWFMIGIIVIGFVVLYGAQELALKVHF